ncbi:putative UDP-N-acetylglucosamine--dolichyl-phosphate N-acetylglucosaminephosphotransferase [Blattamonas nauphoetae]|uniref:UDP-N-acetylglucosamine--dolichyl-phosphate N-acetylglucosaminephosphotransferase n=1 Tax=Blattamonas nauphoetae TaxID=2049346 RepID=A0ABQ9YLA7_9EUKA|nr:putative UDP-N-acetylglucosamine--dolichyl-phosphate N-acetylglucosaminephosphotransferase [Blattamonas nauphoetae]
MDNLRNVNLASISQQQVELENKLKSDQYTPTLLAGMLNQTTAAAQTQQGSPFIEVLADRYGPWLDEHQNDILPDDLEQCQQQQVILKEISQTLETEMDSTQKVEALTNLFNNLKEHGFAPQQLVNSLISQDDMDVYASFLRGDLPFSPPFELGPPSEMLAAVLLAVGVCIFVVANSIIPRAAPSFQKAGMSGIDIGKIRPKEGDPPRVPESLGFVVASVYLSFVLVTFYFVQNQVILSLITYFLINSLAMLLMGFADDVLDLRWRHKIFMSLVVSLPIAKFYLGKTQFAIPSGSFLSKLLDGNHIFELGIFGQLFVVAVNVFCLNCINIYAGINGLECGQSMVIVMSIAIYSIMGIEKGGFSIAGETDVRDMDSATFSFIVSVPLFFACVALFKWNKYPSKVFVGDSFTLWIGASIAGIGLYGRFPVVLLLFFIPEIINFILSVPQLFHTWIPASLKRHLPTPFRDCPRHRIPRINPETGKLHYTPNLTLINAFLFLFGDMTEKMLTNVLIGFQAMCCGIVLLLCWKGRINSNHQRIDFPMSILDVTEKRKKAGLFLEVSLHYHNVFGWLYYIMSTIFIFYKRYRYLELGEWIRSFELVVQVGFFGIAHLLYILSDKHPTMSRPSKPVFTPLPPDDRIRLRPTPHPPKLETTWSRTEPRGRPSATFTKRENIGVPEEPIRQKSPMERADLFQGRVTPSTHKRQKLEELSIVNGDIQSSIAALEDHCRMAAKESEKELIRLFRDKLSDAEKEIDILKKREPEFDAQYWMKKYRQTVNEVELMRAECIRLEDLNSMLEEEMKRTRRDLRENQNELDEHTSRMRGVLKETRAKTEEYESLQQEQDNTPLLPAFSSEPTFVQPTTRSFRASQDQSNSARASGGVPRLRLGQASQRGESPRSSRRSVSAERMSTSRQSGQSSRFDTLPEDIQNIINQNQRTKKRLAQERKNTKILRNAHLASLDEQAQLQSFLNDCISDAQKELSLSTGREFASDEARRRTTELLMSRLKVLNILNDKAFPNISFLKSGLVNIKKQSDSQFSEEFARDRQQLRLSTKA